MWLLRPRTVREYRGWTFPAEEGLPYFMVIVDVVDRRPVQQSVEPVWLLSIWFRLAVMAAQSGRPVTIHGTLHGEAIQT